MLQRRPEGFVRSFGLSKPVDEVFGDAIVDGEINESPRKNPVLTAFILVDFILRLSVFRIILGLKS